MKRDVCVNEPDSTLPALRFRAVFWHESAIIARPMGASSYYFNSYPTTQTTRSPPRAHAKTHHLSPGSPAFPSLYSKRQFRYQRLVKSMFAI